MSVSAIPLRRDFTCTLSFGSLAKKAQARQRRARRLAVACSESIDGMSRTEAAMIGGVGPPNPPRLGSPVQCSVAPDGLLDNWANRPVPRLSTAAMIFSARRSRRIDREQA